ncbi:hypothetical protein CQW23_35224 [Capsicum baccatum]|uniref:Uncharacterized protein n=1 Tax=Capsicum baccatum TaxID=33114 RepID=A0A2G2UWM4_CAPBA|nr:hypothetical protein CQW23_35224 [Capsicum baccatum]
MQEPTKNGHAPPPIESRKSSNPYYVWTWYAAQETDFEQAYIALAPRLRWQAGQDVADRAGIQPNRTCRTQSRVVRPNDPSMRHGAKLPWCHGARISNLTKTPPWQATIRPSAFVIGGVSSIALDSHKNL